MKKIHNKTLIALRAIGFKASTATHSKYPKSFFRAIFRNLKTSITINDFDGDLYMNLELSEHMQRRIFWMGYYNENISHLFKSIIKPGMTVLDVGANIGELTLLAGKHVGPQGNVFAFEPIDNIADKLAHHTKINFFNNISIERYALGEKEDAEKPIYLSCGQKTNDINNGLGSVYGLDGETPIQKIHMITLDSWLEMHGSISSIDLIKIDIEGSELACLRGATTCLAIFRPKIIIEIQNYSSKRAGHKSIDILNFLSDFGYVFHSISSYGRLIPLAPANLLDFQNVLCTPTSFSQKAHEALDSTQPI